MIELVFMMVCDTQRVCVTGVLYLVWSCVPLSERLTDAGLLGRAGVEISADSLALKHARTHARTHTHTLQSAMRTATYEVGQGKKSQSSPVNTLLLLLLFVSGIVQSMTKILV